MKFTTGVMRASKPLGPTSYLQPRYGFETFCKSLATLPPVVPDVLLCLDQLPSNKYRRHEGRDRGRPGNSRRAATRIMGIGFVRRRRTEWKPGKGNRPRYCNCTAGPAGWPQAAPVRPLMMGSRQLGSGRLYSVRSLGNDSLPT